MEGAMALESPWNLFHGILQMAFRMSLPLLNPSDKLMVYRTRLKPGKLLYPIGVTGLAGRRMK